MDNMNNLENATAHYCGQCKRKLPLVAFYFNKRRQCFDRYCKDCRKERSRIYYLHGVKNEFSSLFRIFRTGDHRIAGTFIYILCIFFLLVVRASVLQKCKKQREEEAMRE